MAAAHALIDKALHQTAPASVAANVRIKARRKYGADDWHRRFLVFGRSDTGSGHELRVAHDAAADVAGQTRTIIRLIDIGHVGDIPDRSGGKKPNRLDVVHSGSKTLGIAFVQASEKNTFQNGTTTKQSTRASD